MEISQIRYFSVVAKIGSIRKAAELLHITPAALSKSIGVLERELGEKLILLSGRGIVVSDVGARFAARVEPILADLGRLRDELKRENSEKAAPLRIASFEVFTTWLLGPLMARHFPETPLLLHEMLPGQMESAIAENVADIGVSYLPIPAPKVEHLKVAVITMGVFGLKNQFSGVPFDNLPFVVPVSPVTGSPNKVRGLDGWPDDKNERNVVYRVTLMESAMELCRRGLAVAYLPAPVVRYHNEAVKERFALTVLSFPRMPANITKQNVYLIKRKSHVEGQKTKRFAAAIRALCRE